jgi:hypothetical protein
LAFYGTGKENRLDRFMGVENGRFFLSNGGFISGFTKYGDKFTRLASGPATAILIFSKTVPKRRSGKTSPREMNGRAEKPE